MLSELTRHTSDKENNQNITSEVNRCVNSHRVDHQTCAIVEQRRCEVLRTQVKIDQVGKNGG